MRSFVTKRRTNRIVGYEERGAFRLDRRPARSSADEWPHVEARLHEEEMEPRLSRRAAKPFHVSHDRGFAGFRVARHDWPLVFVFGEIEIRVRGLHFVPAKVWRGERHAGDWRQDLGGRGDTRLTRRRLCPGARSYDRRKQNRTGECPRHRHVVNSSITVRKVERCERWSGAHPA